MQQEKVNITITLKEIVIDVQGIIPKNVQHVKQLVVEEIVKCLRGIEDAMEEATA